MAFTVNAWSACGRRFKLADRRKTPRLGGSYYASTLDTTEADVSNTSWTSPERRLSLRAWIRSFGRMLQTLCHLMKNIPSPLVLTECTSSNQNSPFSCCFLQIISFLFCFCARSRKTLSRLELRSGSLENLWLLRSRRPRRATKGSSSCL